MSNSKKVENQGKKQEREIVCVNDECMNLCQVCLELAPEIFFDLGEKVAVKRQPETEAEKAQVEEAIRVCPADAIIKVKQSKGDKK